MISHKHKLRIRIHGRDNVIYLYDVDLGSCFAIERKDKTLTFQFAKKPTMCKLDPVTQDIKKSLLIPIKPKTWITITFTSSCGSEHIMSFVERMFKKMMLSERFEIISNTSVDKTLGWDCELIHQVSNSVGVSRLTKRTVNLKKGDKLHTYIKKRTHDLVCACCETEEQSKIRIRSISDPFKTKCPGCRRVVTLNFLGWMIVKTTSERDEEEEEILHITCPDLDEDPSNHVFLDKLKSTI